MALARHWHTPHQWAPERAWPEQEEQEGWFETIAVGALRLAALILVGYLGTLV